MARAPTSATLTMAHEVLRVAGFKPEQIKLVMNDTSLPNSGPAGGSRSNVFTGNATRVACEMLLNAMKKPDGTYRTYAEMVAEKSRSSTTASGSRRPARPAAPRPARARRSRSTCTKSSCRKSKSTWRPARRVVKFTTAVDVGTIINRATVDGQIYGGLAQGIGLALTEDFDDLELHTTLRDCGIPYPKDIPDDMEILYLETPRPLGRSAPRASAKRR